MRSRLIKSDASKHRVIIDIRGMKIQRTAMTSSLSLSLSLSLSDNLEAHIKRARQAAALLSRANVGGEQVGSLDSA
jgi:hypothetical protein